MLGLDVTGRAFRAARWGSVAFAAVLGLLGCSNPTRATFHFNIGTESNPLRVVFNADDLGLPEELRDDTTDPPSLHTIPCDAEGPACPSTEEVTVSCDQDACNPDPVTVSVPLGDVLDLESLRVQNDLVDVRSFEVTGVTYAIASNTMTLDLPELTVLWASEGATAGETRLGTIPPISAGERPTGEMAMDDSGSQALADFLLTSRPPRVRFFVEGYFDPQPGDPWPAGSLEVEAIIHVRMEGGLL